MFSLYQFHHHVSEYCPPTVPTPSIALRIHILVPLTHHLDFSLPILLPREGLEMRLPAKKKNLFFSHFSYCLSAPQSFPSGLEDLEPISPTDDFRRRMMGA